uniref:LID domain-containing protein n=1 Tax=Echinostoma caproni TaxID=27848 RepID=A0A183ASQ4_9TREM
LRIFEMNKRLQQRLDDCDSVWWDSFVTDFFEDDATLTLGFITEDGPKPIGRALIPRYFRSIFESGCGELYYNLRLNHEYFHHPSLTLNSESATMTMNMVRSIPATIVVEGRFTLEFTFDELMRIRSWYFHIRSHREMIMRSMLGIQDPAFLEQISKNSTWYGMTSATLNFFRLCVILEPMQELMSRQKAYSLTPRDCLKTTLFQKWQRMMPQESTRQPSKRRKRKGSAAAAEGGSNNSGGSNTGRASKRKQSPVPLPSHHMAQPGDVMIVGEPTLMGGDFGDEDERLITRLENTQYDAAAVSASPHMHPNFPCPNDGPPGLISSPIGTGGPVNNAPGPHPLSSMHFRGPPSGGPATHPGMMSNEGVFSNSLPPMPPHPSSVPVSMMPGQPPIPSSAPGRPMVHNPGMMSGQPYAGPMPTKSSISGGNTPSSRGNLHLS